MNPLDMIFNIEPQAVFAMAFFLYAVMAVVQEFTVIERWYKGIAFGIAIGLSLAYTVPENSRVFVEVLVNGAAVFAIGYLGSIGTNYLQQGSAVRNASASTNTEIGSRRWYSRW